MWNLASYIECENLLDVDGAIEVARRTDDIAVVD